LESQALENDGLGKLGFWAIAVMYFFIAIGSIFSTVILNKLGSVKSMAIGSLFNTPWILAFSLAGLKGDFPEQEQLPFYLSTSFISFTVITLSILNGLG
jgi:hypothetical protein